MQLPAKPGWSGRDTKSHRSGKNFGIPTVIDRMIQQAIDQVLIPIYEEVFDKQSYGFRPGIPFTYSTRFFKLFNKLKESAPANLVQCAGIFVKGQPYKERFSHHMIFGNETPVT